MAKIDKDILNQKQKEAKHVALAFGNKIYDKAVEKGTKIKNIFSFLEMEK